MKQAPPGRVNNNELLIVENAISSKKTGRRQVDGFNAGIEVEEVEIPKSTNSVKLDTLKIRDLEFEFDQIHNDPYWISYASLLIPRFSNHVLSGDITTYLYQWMQRVCVSYDWKLDFIEVQPDYLHWVMDVQISESPAHFIRIIRKYTSSRIFEEFPRFKQENLSNDFWATSNLILAGRSPHPKPLIDEFIRITRMRQGYTWDGLKP